MNVVRRFRLAAAAALAIVVLGAAPESRARTTGLKVQLDYDAVAGCPPVGVFATIVTGRLGYDPFRADAPDRVVVRVESSGRGLEGRLEWWNPRGGSIGEQAFPSRSGDCPELTRAIGFALAVQLQLIAAEAEATTPEPQGGAAPAVAPPPPSRAPPPAAPSEDTRHGTGSPPGGPSAIVGAGAAAGLGISADSTAVGRLFVTFEWPHLAVEVGGEASLPSTTHRADGGGFSQTDLLATLAGCAILSPWSACAVAKIGEIRATGQGVDVPLTASALMLQAGLRLAASHTLPRHIFVAARAEALAQVARAAVTLDSTTVWTAPRFAALFGIDVGLRFR